LNVFYGASHALQGVDLQLVTGALSVVGRNGMGKTTLCKAIMGLVPVASGSISFHGQPLVGRSPADIARAGIGYVPQGRRLWRSLTVEEHLKMVERKGGAWTIERIFSTFPRLAERRGNGGAQLSGGEQQMLAISRALLMNPKLLLMDEPTEGLAPVIVAQLEELLVQLAQDGEIDVLVIEQNIGVACAIAETVAIMVNGRAQESAVATPGGPVKIYVSNPTPPTRWSKPVPVEVLERTARILTAQPLMGAAAAQAEIRPLSMPGAEVILVAGTLDTKGAELRFMRDQIRAAGLPVRLVDLSTTGGHSGADIPAHQIAAFHPRGAAGVFTGDRGAAVAGMTEAFKRWIERQTGIAGILSAGGSGGTALVAPAMRALPIGIPKLIVSTIASGDVRAYVGAADITMMHSVADVQGLNAITEDILGNAAQAMIGMVQARRAAKPRQPQRPAVALSMFGVTTLCIRQIAGALGKEWDCLIFHATGIGGQSMEKLIESQRVAGVIDITTTEIADMLFGGILPATADRFGAVIRTRLPYIGSVGAVDMVNFGPPETVPEIYRGRQFYQHNPQVTLMRTTAAECAAIGQWIAARLNLMDGPVRFYLPEGGVSALDAPGQAFHDPAAREALFRAIEAAFRQGPNRQLLRVRDHINDPAFAAMVVAEFQKLLGPPRVSRRKQGAP